MIPNAMTSSEHTPIPSDSHRPRGRFWRPTPMVVKGWVAPEVVWPCCWPIWLQRDPSRRDEHCDVAHPAGTGGPQTPTPEGGSPPLARGVLCPNQRNDTLGENDETLPLIIESARYMA